MHSTRTGSIRSRSSRSRSSRSSKKASALLAAQTAQLDVELAEKEKEIIQAKKKALDKWHQLSQAASDEEGSRSDPGSLTFEHQDRLGELRGWANPEAPPYVPPHPAGDVKRTQQWVENLSRSPEVLESGPQRTVLANTTSHTDTVAHALIRANLPKIEPDTFTGDATQFYPWKSMFKGMLEGAQVSATQEMSLILKYTKEKPRMLTENFRRRTLPPEQCLQLLWEEMERRFGNLTVVSTAYFKQLARAASFRDDDAVQLQVFADLCEDVSSQMATLPTLQALNYPTQLGIIIKCLPPKITSKWNNAVVEYTRKHGNSFPPFSEFTDFIVKRADLLNNPNILAQLGETKGRSREVQVFHTQSREETHCEFHDMPGHNLSSCKGFLRLNYDDRKKFVSANRLCFRCLQANCSVKACEAEVSCSVCKSSKHLSVLHMSSGQNQGATARRETDESADVTSLKTNLSNHYSCGKIVLLHVSSPSKPDVRFQVYGILDDASNRSLISSELINQLDIDAASVPYQMSTCTSRSEQRWGREVNGLRICGVNGNKWIQLPTLLECDIPQNKEEIPDPQDVRKHPHLQGIAPQIPSIQDDTNIHLLLGRDTPEALKIRKSINGAADQPWAQRTDLGWTVSGRLCERLGSGRTHLNCNKTNISSSECDKFFDIKDLFVTTEHDEEPAPSIDDRKFISIMTKGFKFDDDGHVELPLPFRHGPPLLPNNTSLAMGRLQSLLKSFRKNPQLEEDYFKFMGEVLKRDHARKSASPSIPPIKDTEIKENLSRYRFPPMQKGWIIPHFGVYHPRKVRKLRVVFDSAAQLRGTSLNTHLLKGPDCVNSLLGILLRFRKEAVGITLDIEMMFHSFHVPEADRSFLKFLWYEDNDKEKPIQEYVLRVHNFGNRSSPAVCTYGLRKLAEIAAFTTNQSDSLPRLSAKGQTFIQQDSYIDDLITSVPSEAEAVSLIEETQKCLAAAKLKVHKITSNVRNVMTRFSSEVLNEHKEFEPSTSLPVQRSLGMCWSITGDYFTYSHIDQGKPYTKRGILSELNSYFDPMGLISPVLLVGKFLLRELTRKAGPGTLSIGWDDPLPTELREKWEMWRNDLKFISQVKIPRCFDTLIPESSSHHREPQFIMGFSDACDSSIGIAIYICRRVDSSIHAELVYSQSRLSPAQATSTPRLELVAAVALAEASKRVVAELRTTIAAIHLFSDSTIVLGYIKNESRSFLTYVANRVQRIRNVSHPEQWAYVESSRNPADIASRGCGVKTLLNAQWFHLERELCELEQPVREFPVFPDDPEVRHVSVRVTRVTGPSLNQRLNKFSDWNKAQVGIAKLIAKIQSFRSKCSPPPRVSLDHLKRAHNVMIREAQLTYSRNSGVCSDRRLRKLNPFIDADGNIRVGGRLNKSEVPYVEKHPLILPKKSHITMLLIRRIHSENKHQGRHITSGAIRTAGYWIQHGSKDIAYVIHRCVTCRKLRGPLIQQQMSNLPMERGVQCPPYTYVGCDIFGHWEVLTRKTRGGSANSKRWALLITCMYSRAVHIEVVEEMSSASLLCALRRFISLRGSIRALFSDNGRNMVGAANQLAAKEADDALQNFATQNQFQWHFQPPHASNFGGMFERQIRSIRSVLDAVLTTTNVTLTHEILTTFLCEAAAIINSRPLADNPIDLDAPPLTPASLVTMKRKPLTAPDFQFVKQDAYAKHWWRRAQYLAEQFWSRWKTEYLQMLQERSKWQNTTRNLRVGDVVAMKDETASRRYEWPMARVIEAYPSSDGLVRKVRLRLAGPKELERPASQLVLLIAFGHHVELPTSSRS